MRIPKLVPGAVAVLLACSTGGGKEFTPVSNTDFGRLSPDQLEPVRAARADVDAARDGVARAELRLQDANHEHGYATSEETAARADAQRAAADLKAAQESGDRAGISRAQALAETARLRAQAATAHHRYAEQLVAACQGDVAAARANATAQEAALERAKLTALEQAQIPAASKYDPARFDRHVAETRNAAAQARSRAASADASAQQALRTWRSLDERWQARARDLGWTG